VFSLTRPLGRLKFLFGVTGVNIALGLVVLVALTFRPSGAGHLAVIILVAALQIVWMTLHARRFADAGRGPLGSIVVFLFGLAVFVVGYLIFAALWSSPEVQREAFRTAGGLGGSVLPLHIETNPLVLDAGRALAGWFGAAGAVVLSGVILFGFAATAMLAGAFTLFALVLSSRNQPASMLSGQQRFQRIR
jgi:hypothetical protein